ncbi:MAG: ATP-binding protein [Armatimonadota bacterium]
MPEQTTITIRHTADIGPARRQAKAMAHALGFDEKASEEIAIVTTELATNLIRHAQGGRLILTPVTDHSSTLQPQELNTLAQQQRTALRIEAVDQGPGIRNIEQAFTDGYSTAGSLGYGLGAINRLMDDVKVESEPGRGTRLTCLRRLRAREVQYDNREVPFLLDISAATRAYPGMELNGDTFVIKQWSRGALVGVIDGVGHGQFAHRAAQSARHYIETHYDRPLNALFLGTSRACHATRGVVMALARFEYQSSVAQPLFDGYETHGHNADPTTVLSFAGVGNIEARVFGGADHLSLLVKRGLIGLSNTMPHVHVTTHPWQRQHLLVLHSDGIRSNWRLDDFPMLADASADVMARYLLNHLARDEDDATVLVVKGKS